MAESICQKHGYWIAEKFFNLMVYRCSECGSVFYFYNNICSNINLPKNCTACNAKMD